MRDKLRIAGLIEESIVDGPGIRMVIFAQGCKHNCKGCHNQHTHSFDGGSLIGVDVIVKLFKENPLLDGITFSGGEPLEQVEAFTKLAYEIKQLGKHVMVYTGYVFENLFNYPNEIKKYMDLLKFTDILVDGPFIESQKNYLLKFRGSSNQRLIDIQNSISTGKTIIINDSMI